MRIYIVVLILTLAPSLMYVTANASTDIYVHPPLTEVEIEFIKEFEEYISNVSDQHQSPKVQESITPTKEDKTFPLADMWYLWVDLFTK